MGSKLSALLQIRTNTSCAISCAYRCLRRFRMRRNTEPLRPDRIIRPWPSHPAPQCVGAVLCGANQNFRKEPQIRKADSGCQTLAFWIQRQCTKSRRRAGIEIEREPIGIILHEVCADHWMHVQFVREQMKRPGGVRAALSAKISLTLRVGPLASPPRKLNQITNHAAYVDC